MTTKAPPETLGGAFTSPQHVLIDNAATIVKRRDRQQAYRAARTHCTNQNGQKTT